MDSPSSDLLKEIIREKRTDRRWKNFRFIVWVALILFGAWIIFGESAQSSLNGSHYVALLRLNGMIDPEGHFSGAEVVPLLNDMFKDTDAKGIVLDINSGGGTPVQASIIHDAIIQLKKKYHKKVIVVGEDMLTSGAYYVAVAGDKIYVNPNTITGSIGVIMKGFGFSDLIKKVGIERRVYVSGSDKDRLDPFLPQSPADVAKIKQVIDEVHNNFDQVVLEGRKGKLHADPKVLFTGDFWSGQTAVRLGLADDLGNLTDVIEKEFKTSHYHEYNSSPGLLKLLSSGLNSSFNAVLESLSTKLQ